MLDEPRTGAVVESPLRLVGEALAFEGTVEVEIRADGEAEPIDPVAAAEVDLDVQAAAGLGVLVAEQAEVEVDRSGPRRGAGPAQPRRTGAAGHRRHRTP